MTMTLDLPAADEAAFRELANAPAETRAAVLQEAIGILRRGATTNGTTANGNGLAKNGARPTNHRLAAWLAQLDAAAPAIAAGTLKPINGDDITRFIHEDREEREREMEAAAGGYAR